MKVINNSRKAIPMHRIRKTILKLFQVRVTLKVEFDSDSSPSPGDYDFGEDRHGSWSVTPNDAVDNLPAAFIHCTNDSLGQRVFGYAYLFLEANTTSPFTIT